MASSHAGSNAPGASRRQRRSQYYHQAPSTRPQYRPVVVLRRSISDDSIMENNMVTVQTTAPTPTTYAAAAGAKPSSSSTAAPSSSILHENRNKSPVNRPPPPIQSQRPSASTASLVQRFMQDSRHEMAVVSNMVMAPWLMAPLIHPSPSPTSSQSLNDAELTGDNEETYSYYVDVNTLPAASTPMKPPHQPFFYSDSPAMSYDDIQAAIINALDADKNDGGGRHCMVRLESHPRASVRTHPWVHLPSLESLPSSHQGCLLDKPVAPRHICPVQVLVQCNLSGCSVEHESAITFSSLVSTAPAAGYMNPIHRYQMYASVRRSQTILLVLDASKPMLVKDDWLMNIVSREAGVLGKRLLVLLVRDGVRDAAAPTAAGASTVPADAAGDSSISALHLITAPESPRCLSARECRDSFRINRNDIFKCDRRDLMDVQRVWFHINRHLDTRPGNLFPSFPVPSPHVRAMSDGTFDQVSSLVNQQMSDAAFMQSILSSSAFSLSGFVTNYPDFRSVVGDMCAGHHPNVLHDALGEYMTILGACFLGYRLLDIFSNMASHPAVAMLSCLYQVCLSRLSFPMPSIPNLVEWISGQMHTSFRDAGTNFVSNTSVAAAVGSPQPDQAAAAAPIPMAHLMQDEVLRSLLQERVSRRLLTIPHVELLVIFQRYIAVIKQCCI